MGAANNTCDNLKGVLPVQAYAEASGLPHPLNIDDFECRRLVTATNAQLFAETHLISLFLPIWNKDTGVCWGISMHGDAAETRSNDRTPWDVLHLGRRWAMDAIRIDSKSETQIMADIASHVGARDQIIELFLEAFAQDPMVAAVPVQDEDGEIEQDAAPD